MLIQLLDFPLAIKKATADRHPNMMMSVNDETQETSWEVPGAEPAPATAALPAVSEASRDGATTSSRPSPSG